MTIADAYGPGKFGLSFELFPPKTADGIANVLEHVGQLMRFAPDYITCTYGAGGSTQDRTLQVIERVRAKHDIPVATHLTCVGRTAAQIGEYLDRAVAIGVANVVALRGDPPQGETTFRAVEGGFAYANELVAFLRQRHADWGIAVGGYPETHQEAVSPEADLQYLQRKVAAGADVVITQLFYDNADYFRFRDRCGALGIAAPIVPGLLPVTNLAQIQRIASLCGAKLPPVFAQGLTKFADDAAAQFDLGVEFATRQAEELIAGGVPGIHFYVLNKSEATSRVLQGCRLPQHGARGA